MGQSFEVKRLRSEDVEQMEELNALFGDVFEDPDSYHAHPPQRAYLERWLAKDHVFALVACDGAGQITGGLVAYELEKFEQRRSEVYIYDLAVREHARRRGVATELIEALRGLARARGAWVVFVQADHGDDPAIALYTKLGVREDVLHFDIPVNGGEPR